MLAWPTVVRWPGAEKSGDLAFGLLPYAAAYVSAYGDEPGDDEFVSDW